MDTIKPQIMVGFNLGSYVEDVAHYNVCALRSEATDEDYNLGTGVQTSIRELCDLILILKKSNLKVTYKPYSVDDARHR